jgi:hypothetical protein
MLQFPWRKLTLQPRKAMPATIGFMLSSAQNHSYNNTDDHHQKHFPFTGIMEFPELCWNSELYTFSLQSFPGKNLRCEDPFGPHNGCFLQQTNSEAADPLLEAFPRDW